MDWKNIKRLTVYALCFVADFLEHRLHVSGHVFARVDELIEQLYAGSAAQAAAFLVAAVCAFIALPMLLFVGWLW